MPSARVVRVLCSIAAALALGALAAVASAAIVGRPGTATSVREHAGTSVFSQYDQQARRWSLMVRDTAGTARRLAIAPSATPLDADIGTDTDGRPELIYQRCSGFAHTRHAGFVTYVPQDCDLYVYSLANASGERPVRNANDPANNDIDATLWRGRIAWTRDYASGPVVYTKLLSAARSTPSTRLPGVPQQRCASDGRCATTTARSVSSLELWGNNLGVIVRYTCQVCVGIVDTELRLDDVAGRSSRMIKRVVTGMNGQGLIGPSFTAGGRLAWYEACAVAETSCRSFAGPWRYGLSAHAYQRASGPILVSGFADAGSSLYEVRDCFSAVDFAGPTQPDISAACRIDQSDAPAYRTASG